MTKSSKAACLSGFLFPGCGQFYLKQAIKGSVFAIIAILCFCILLPPAFSILSKVPELANEIATGNAVNITEWMEQEMKVFQQPHILWAKIVMVVIWLVSIVDAWRGGRRENI